MKPDRAVAGLVAVCVAACGCGGPTRGAGVHARSPYGAAATRSTGEGRPPLSVVVRDGDARGALAVAVTTEGIAADRGALAGVALAALVQERLAARGVDAAATGGWNGWRLRVLLGSTADAPKVVDALRGALLSRVAPDEAAMAAVGRKVSALGRRPLADRSLVDVAQCTGEAYGTGGETAPSAAELESWRAAAHGLGRVAIATAGDASLADAAALALGRAPAWPLGAAVTPSAWPPLDARVVSYDASGEIAPGAARVVVVARTATPERAVGAAPALGEVHGPLASRLAALEAPARVRSVVATAHVDGGCVAIAIELAARDLGTNAPVHIATAAALARQEMAVEIGDTIAPVDLGRALVTRASDPRDAAERAAWWALAGRKAGAADDELRMTLAVGIAPARDASEPTPPARASAIRGEIDRATFAWRAPVVESRTRVEQGQGEAWILLASLCGVLAEATHDAGLGAAVATAAAAQAADGAGDAGVEAFIAADGVGVLVHGGARKGESPRALVRRLADVAARAFAADPLDPDRLAQARTELLARSARPFARALGTLAGAIAPGHPSWLQPMGTRDGLASASDAAMAMRATSIRAGPLRVAVLGNADAAQADAAVRAVDRWVARRPGESRACSPVPVLATPRAGTYAVDLAAGAPSEALIAIPLPPGDDASLSAATWLAATLDGPGGLLAHAGGDIGGRGGDTNAGPMALSWDAAVVGAPRSPAMVVRATTPDASLDSAVAQGRALLDRLRQGALREEDRARASASIAQSRLTASLDPRSRIVALWRGELPSAAPSLETLRSFAATALRDEALVIVAARPQRPESDGTSPGAREPRVRTRD